MSDPNIAICPQCSQSITPEDTIIFRFGVLGHLDCRRPRVLNAEERTLVFVYCQDHQICDCAPCKVKFRLREVASIDHFGIRSFTCQWCHADLVDSVRTHLYSCAMLPSEVRRKAKLAREAAKLLVKRTHELNGAADVLMREAESALHELRRTIRESPRPRPDGPLARGSR